MASQPRTSILEPLQRLTTALADRYRVEHKLGEGGMATVYLAHDLRHEREVAIKVLHPDLGAVLGSERFLSEIKTTARLQHPHILPLLDSGAADGLLYYVMPYVRGETLRGRLSRERQLPLDDAVRIAREVADALGAAHGLGIIHRDIKPENILLQGGHALVADFGIALAVQHAGGARMTQTGLSLGTPQYMSPEQAMGERAVDARSDIYALGAVTYEMLTGDPPFTGATVQAIIAKALTERPIPPSTVRDTVPPGVEHAVLRALAKLPADRFATAGEFVVALGDASATRYLTPSRAAPPPARPSVGLIAAGAGLAAVALAAGWALGKAGSGNGSASAPSSTRFVLEARAGEVTPNIIGKVFALSPDGATIVYVASLGGQPQQLFKRRYDELGATAIPGTSGATDPSFSPDGRWIAFFTGSQLAKIPLEGGTPFQIATVPGATSRGLTWAGNGELVFATNASATLFAVNENGGAIRQVFRAPGHHGLRWPVALAGSDELLFSSFSATGDSVFVYHGSLGDGEFTRVNTESYHPLGVVDDRLIYVNRSGDVMAAPYDAGARVTTGPGQRIVSGVSMSIGTGFGVATLSHSGDLLYRDGNTESQLVFADAKGNVRLAVTDTLGYATPRFSPDGRRLVVTVESFSRRGLFLLDRASGILSRFTEDDVGTIRDRPEWTADGRRLIYRRQAQVGNVIVTRPVDRTGGETPVPGPRVAVNEMVMSSDGKTVIARVSSGIASSQDLWWWQPPDTTFHKFTEDLVFETGARFSPDGKWVAYTAEAAGVREVYVAPFPGPGGATQVSKGGAGLPVWGADGRTIYYPQVNRMMATSVTFSPSAEVTGTRTVFEGNYSLDDALHAPFDISKDGVFALVRPVRPARSVVIRDFRTEMRNQIARLGAR